MLHIWNKYSTASYEGYREATRSASTVMNPHSAGLATFYVIYSLTYSFNKRTGKYQLTGTIGNTKVRDTGAEVTPGSNYYYYVSVGDPIDSSYTDDLVYKGNPTVKYGYHGGLGYTCNYFNAKWHTYAEQTTIYEQGSYIGKVTSANASTFPSNEQHTDGYWYVYQGQG